MESTAVYPLWPLSNTLLRFLCHFARVTFTSLCDTATYSHYIPFEIYMRQNRNFNCPYFCDCFMPRNSSSPITFCLVLLRQTCAPGITCPLRHARLYTPLPNHISYNAMLARFLYRLIEKKTVPMKSFTIILYNPL